MLSPHTKQELTTTMSDTSETKNILHGPVPLIPISEGTAGQLLFDALKRYEHLPIAAICAGTQKTISYRELLEGSCRLAYGLQNLGLTLESVVAIFSESSTYYYYPLLASLFLGVVVAPLSPDYVGSELQHIANISKPQILFCSQKNLTKALALQQSCKFIQKIFVLDLEDTTDGVESLNSLMSATTDTHHFSPVKFNANEQVALILCSSGTTGLPKGVMITHRNLVVRFAQLKDPIYGIISKPGTTAFSILPMFHVGGIVFMLMYLMLGFQSVIMNKFSLNLYLKSIQQYKVKTSFVAPPVMSLLAKTSLIEKYDLSSLRDIGCAGAPVSKGILSEVLKKLPYLREVRQAYGLTETTQVVTYCPRGDAKVGSLGKLVPFTQAKVIHIETNQPLGPHQPGELCFKGEFVMKGYVRNVTETQSAIDRDGWFHTGDLGYYDENYHFYIVDRLKELIKYKGYQVSPAELEAILMHHPKIKDAVVIGIEDKFAGQLPRAYVVKQPNKVLTEQEVCDFIAGQVSNPKHLRGGVVFLDELPRISIGKVARKLLRESNQPKVCKL